MINSKLPAPLDGAADLRWIVVLGLAHATSMGFALVLAQLDLPRPRPHPAVDSTI